MSVDPFTLLQGVAQLSVTFAGFGSLASALTPQQHRDDTRVDAGRLLHMLINSLVILVLSLFPSVFALFAPSERWLWSGSAGLALLAVALVAPGMLARTARMTHYSGFHKGAVTANIALAVIAVVAFLLCVLGVPAHSLAASYAAGLVALLLICAITFFRITASLRTAAHAGLGRVGDAGGAEIGVQAPR